MRELVRQKVVDLRPAGRTAQPEPDPPEPGDVFVSTVQRIRTAVGSDSVSGMPATGLHRLRVLNHQLVSPEYLAATLRGPWNNRFLHGTTIARAAIRELEVPLLPLAEQAEIVRLMNAAHVIMQTASGLSSDAEFAEEILLESIRHSVHLDPPEASHGAAKVESRRGGDAEVDNGE